MPTITLETETEIERLQLVPLLGDTSRYVATLTLVLLVDSAGADALEPLMDRCCEVEIKMTAMEKKESE